MTRDELLVRAKARKYADLDPADWGEGVRVRSLTARERLDYEAWAGTEKTGSEEEQGTRQLCGLLARCIVGPDGEPVLQPGDYLELLNLEASVLTRAFRVVTAINGMGKDAQEQAEKNSGSGPCAA